MCEHCPLWFPWMVLPVPSGSPPHPVLMRLGRVLERGPPGPPDLSFFVAVSSPVLCALNSGRLGLPRLSAVSLQAGESTGLHPAPLSCPAAWTSLQAASWGSRGLTVFVSCLSGIAAPHCLMSSASHGNCCFIYVALFMVVSVKRANQSLLLRLDWRCSVNFLLQLFYFSSPFVFFLKVFFLLIFPHLSIMCTFFPIILEHVFVLGALKSVWCLENLGHLSIGFGRSLIYINLMNHIYFNL